MHTPVLDLYYKYLYYQVVFARVNTWKVLRNSLHWSSWTELACFSGFTRFCPIFVCVCMFIWVYVCPCIYPTNKQLVRRAAITLAQDKYVLPYFQELLQTLLKLSRFASLLAHRWAESRSRCKLKQREWALLHVRARPGVITPLCLGAYIPLNNVTHSKARIAVMKKGATDNDLLPWNLPFYFFFLPSVDLYCLLLLPLKNLCWKEIQGRGWYFFNLLCKGFRAHFTENYLITCMV